MATTDEIECPHCAKGNQPRVRPETHELVHDFIKDLGPGSRQVSQTLCWRDPRSAAMKARAVTAP